MGQDHHWNGKRWHPFRDIRRDNVQPDGSKGQRVVPHNGRAPMNHIRHRGLFSLIFKRVAAQEVVQSMLAAAKSLQVMPSRQLLNLRQTFVSFNRHPLRTLASPNLPLARLCHTMYVRGSPCHRLSLHANPDGSTFASPTRKTTSSGGSPQLVANLSQNSS